MRWECSWLSGKGSDSFSPASLRIKPGVACGCGDVGLARSQWPMLAGCPWDAPPLAGSQRRDLEAPLVLAGGWS